MTPRIEFDRRLAAIRARMEARNLDLLLIYSTPGSLRFGQRGHVMYVSGYEPYFGDTMLLMQSGMRDVKHETYIQMARAIGVPEKRIRDKHASRNAILPVLSRFVINLPYLLTAAVIIEHATGWRGVGQVMYDTVYYQNSYVYMGILIVVGLMALFARLALDIAYAFLDPRIRYGQSSV